MRLHGPLAAFARSFHFPGLLLVLALLATAPASAQFQSSSTTGSSAFSRPGTTSRSDNTGRYDRSDRSSRSSRSTRSNDSDSRSSRSSSRDSDRRGSRDRDDDRSSERNETGLPGATGSDGESSGRAVPQAVSELAAKKRASSRPSGGANVIPGEPGGIPTYEISAQIETATIYFDPSQVVVSPGRRFGTPLVFYNPKGLPVDRMDLWIRYPVELIEPVAVDTSELKPFVSGEVTRSVWRRSGLVRVSATFSTPMTTLVQPLVRLGWRAVPSEGSAIVKLEAPEGERLLVGAGDRNLLETSRVGNRGLVSLEVRVGEEIPEPEDLPLRILGESETPGLPDVRRGAGVRLGLLPRSEMVHEGEISTADVVLLNPEVVEFDDLRFRLRFNPEEIEILDADENNYVAEGINAYDGGFHDSHPFDLHHANQADIAAGRLDYHVGASGGPRGYPSGTIARVVFRMKKRAGGAAIWFESLDPVSGRMISDVRARGVSVLGSEEMDSVRALHNAMISAAPLR